MRRLLVVINLFLIILRISAQETGDCASVIEASIAQGLQLCGRLERGQACFAAGEASMGEGVSTHFAGSRIPLENIQSLETAPFNAEDGSYGVGLLNTHANLPLDIARQGVMFLLLGATSVENAVPYEQAFVPAAPVTITTLTFVNLRARPSIGDAVLGSVNFGVTLAADGVSGDGEWYRVTYNGAPAWVHRSLVAGSGLDALPVINTDQHGLMQEFYLNTASGQGADCAQSLDALVIQGLVEQPVHLTVNGVEMDILSTVALRGSERPYYEFLRDPDWQSLQIAESASDDAVCRFLQLMVIDGSAFLNDYLFSVARGQQAYAFSCSPGAPLLWDRVALISAADLDRLQILEELPEGVLRYPVDVPSPGEAGQIAAQLESAAARPTSAPPPLSIPTPIVSPEASEMCAGFRPTHPIDGVGFGRVRFYWDPAPYATAYLINLYNSRGELAISVESRNQYSHLVDTTSTLLFDGSATSWIYYELLALRDGEVICRSPLLHMMRAQVPDPDCPPEMWYPDVCPEDVISNDT